MNDPLLSGMDDKKEQKFYLILALILSVPAFFVHLGMHPYIEDESIRALVALEMSIKEQYFFPTLGGKAYFAKPPLYNWILLVFAHILGGLSEWTTRIPTVLFLYGYGLYIYHVHKRLKFSNLFAITIAFLFLTCGRILFWDSFLGLIDVFFSWVMYAMIMEMYFKWKKQAWWSFFLIAYFLFTVGYLLKGLPAFLFLGLTFFWIACLDRSFLKKLLSVPNLIGLLVPAILIGGYYYMYNQTGNYENSVEGLLEQATNRTVVHYDILAVIKHIFTYPFENIYHFLPWSLLVFVLFAKNTLKKIVRHPYILFCSGAFLINLLPYWVSPEVFPRYILMLVPMSFTILFWLYASLEQGNRRYRYYQWLFNFLGLGAILFMGISLINDKIFLVSYPLVKGGLCLLGLGILGYLLLRTQYKILVIINMLFVLRIAFNLFIVPIRTIEDKGLRAKNDAIEIAQKYGDREIRMYRKSIRDYTTIFHIEKKIGKIISVTDEAEVLIYNPFYPFQLPAGYGIVDSIYVRRVDDYMYILERE